MTFSYRDIESSSNEVEIAARLQGNSILHITLIFVAPRWAPMTIGATDIVVTHQRAANGLSKRTPSEKLEALGFDTLYYIGSRR